MKYEMTFRTSEYGTLVPKLPEGMFVFEHLLMGDVQGSDGSDYFELIDKVLSGESEFEEISGNAIYVEIRKDKTKAIQHFGEEAECEIETEEFRNLIEAYVKERRKK